MRSLDAALAKALKKTTISPNASPNKARPTKSQSSPPSTTDKKQNAKKKYEDLVYFTLPPLHVHILEDLHKTYPALWNISLCYCQTLTTSLLSSLRRFAAIGFLDLSYTNIDFLTIQQCLKDVVILKLNVVDCPLLKIEYGYTFDDADSSTNTKCIVPGNENRGFLIYALPNIWSINDNFITFNERRYWNHYFSAAGKGKHSELLAKYYNINSPTTRGGFVTTQEKTEARHWSPRAKYALARMPKFFGMPLEEDQFKLKVLMKESVDRVWDSCKYASLRKGLTIVPPEPLIFALLDLLISSTSTLVYTNATTSKTVQKPLPLETRLIFLHTMVASLYADIPKPVLHKVLHATMSGIATAAMGGNAATSSQLSLEKLFEKYSMDNKSYESVEVYQTSRFRFEDSDKMIEMQRCGYQPEILTWWNTNATAIENWSPVYWSFGAKLAVIELLTARLELDLERGELGLMSLLSSMKSTSQQHSPLQKNNDMSESTQDAKTEAQTLFKTYKTSIGQSLAYAYKTHSEFFPQTSWNTAAANSETSQLVFASPRNVSIVAPSMREATLSGLPPLSASVVQLRHYHGEQSIHDGRPRTATLSRQQSHPSPASNVSAYEMISLGMEGNTQSWHIRDFWQFVNERAIQSTSLITATPSTPVTKLPSTTRQYHFPTPTSKTETILAQAASKPLLINRRLFLKEWTRQMLQALNIVALGYPESSGDGLEAYKRDLNNALEDIIVILGVRENFDHSDEEAVEREQMQNEAPRPEGAEETNVQRQRAATVQWKLSFWNRIRGVLSQID